VIDPALHRFCRDAFILARYGGPGEARPDGRAWERAVSRGLWIEGLDRRQQAGTLGLFGMGGRSGAPHEIDGAGHGSNLGLWLEAKARVEVTKDHVAVFAFKALDLYREAAARDAEATARAEWWPALVSSEECSVSVRRSCFAMGVVLCEPVRLPLPTLLRVAANPMSDCHLDDRLLGEAVRLGERVCRSMQDRWRLDAARRELALSIDAPGADEIGDLLFVQRELSDALMDYYDSHAPGSLEARGSELGDRLRACARAW
jgi:hypothetical protein